MKRVVSILTAVVMAFTLSGYVAFATEGAQTDKGNTPPKTAPVVKTLSGYNAVKLTWKKVEGAQGYNVGIKVDGQWRRPKGGLITSPNKTSFEFADTVKLVNSSGKVIDKVKMIPNANNMYQFRVMAVTFKDGKKDAKHIDGTATNGKWKGNIKMSKVVKDKPVSRMLIQFKMKRTKTVRGVKFKKGKTYRAYKGGQGVYVVKKNGKSCRVPKIACRNVRAIYSGPKNKNYTKKETVYFVNRYIKKNKVKPSKGKYLIFISTYNQHLYVLKRSGKGWTYTDRNWEMCTGKATTPSLVGHRKIVRKMSSFHGIRYWSCVYSINAMHGLRSKAWAKKLGKPASNGCYRNPTQKARWIYNNCPIGTRVIIF